MLDPHRAATSSGHTRHAFRNGSAHTSPHGHSEPLAPIAAYRTDHETRYRITYKDISAKDPEFDDIQIAKISVIGESLKHGDAVMWAYSIRSVGDTADIDQLYQAATNASQELADALATLRGWEPGIVGNPDPGPILVLDSMDIPPNANAFVRGLVAALSQGVVDKPGYLDASRLIVSIQSPAPFTQDALGPEMGLLMDRLKVKPSWVVPWKPADPDFHALVK